ncbi:CaiB/BaiF CoA transferase family protein [Tomitella biformata]|uniref:CaiB/BaiF CoA transferase family protein n=1 Tax=Tomitella biformata TaxID=630403 RepID=UPI0004659DEC|nr:CoA transferase [Tomitella biformata]
MTTKVGPLSGLRVIDWTVWQQGPVAGAMLGDLGADVIKVESRNGGDSGRAMLAFENGPSPYFEVNNRNKRGITIDLKKPEGVDLLKKLIAESDVFIQNFRPTIAESLGLDYDTLRAENPGLIYGSASAYGHKGPERTSRAYDLLGQARSGILLAPGTNELTVPDGGLADQMGAIMLAYGVLAAVVAKERHGVGQRVDTSLFGSMLALRALPLARAIMTVDGVEAPMPFIQHSGGAIANRLEPGNPLWNHYLCADDSWITLAMVQSDPHWSDFLKALGNPETLTADPRFTDHVVRCQNAGACVPLLDEIFATRPRAEWLSRFREVGDLPITGINSTADAANDPQAIANEYVTSFDHPAVGPLRVPGFPITLSETPASIRYPAPEYGEHTETILLEVLKMDWDEITALRELKVI